LSNILTAAKNERTRFDFVEILYGGEIAVMTYDAEKIKDRQIKPILQPLQLLIALLTYSPTRYSSSGSH